MGAICVHEFMSLDGVIDAPIWTFDYGFDAKMGEVLGAVTERSAGVLLGRTTYEMFEPAWSTRTADAPLKNRKAIDRTSGYRRLVARASRSWNNECGRSLV